jgi:lauroyl/myristoyl acyltransferase
LQRIQAEMAADSLCVWLPDQGPGPIARVPFLASHLDVRLGAFRLARRARCPVLPFFLTAAPRPPRFCVEFTPPLDVDGAGDPCVPLSAFAAVYSTQARRRPWHLPYHSSGRLLLGQAPDEEVDEAAEGAERLE